MNGFIVFHEGMPGQLVLQTKSDRLYKNVPAEGILLREDANATVFPTRKLARAAIARSAKYHSQKYQEAGAGELNDWTQMRDKSLYHITELHPVKGGAS